MLHIGVSSGFLYPDPARTMAPQKTFQLLECDMVRYLARDDVLPVLIPNADGNRFESYLNDMQGFVLQGGNDVHPSTYGEPHLDAQKWPGDKHRDEYEARILDHAVRKKKPVLGICRGCQFINVFFGGTLYQDIPTQIGTAVRHRDPVLYDRLHHEVQLVRGGALSSLYGGARLLFVNSIHHQTIKSLGRDLVVEAVSPGDAIIEAVRYARLEDHFVLGVQWHPEFAHTLEGQVSDPTPLYDHFLDRVRQRA